MQIGVGIDITKRSSGLQLVKRLNKVLVVHVHDYNTGKAAKKFTSLLLE